MKQPRKHTALLFIALGIIALLLLVIDMATGDTYIPVSKVWAVLTGGECDEMTRNILLSIRFIRGNSGGTDRRGTLRKRFADADSFPKSIGGSLFAGSKFRCRIRGCLVYIGSSTARLV